jgi:hypothetical protein
MQGIRSTWVPLVGMAVTGVSLLASVAWAGGGGPGDGQPFQPCFSYCTGQVPPACSEVICCCDVAGTATCVCQTTCTGCHGE